MIPTENDSSRRARDLFARAAIFTLSATSIWSLLVEFYGWAPMRTFTFFVFLPASVVLLVWGLIDRSARHVNGGQIWKMVWIGVVAGFVAACVYDIFRLPFVFSKPLGLDPVVPALPLFKVFPMFGEMILMPKQNDAVTRFWVHLVGWAYHFSNGMTFGIMYLALLGDAARRSWLWGVAMAVGIEIGLLVTPYAKTFGISITPTFVVVTLTAHIVFGAVMGWLARHLAQRPETVSEAAIA